MREPRLLLKEQKVNLYNYGQKLGLMPFFSSGTALE